MSFEKKKIRKVTIYTATSSYTLYNWGKGSWIECLTYITILLFYTTVILSWRLCYGENQEITHPSQETYDYSRIQYKIKNQTLGTRIVV